jgi:hypothetical protein
MTPFLRDFFAQIHHPILACGEIVDDEIAELFANAKELSRKAEQDIRNSCVGDPGDMWNSMNTKISW